MTGDADADTFNNESSKDFSFFDDEVDEEEVRKKRRKEKMEDLYDVVDELVMYRENTSNGIIRSPHWGGELLLSFGGREGETYQMTGEMTGETRGGGGSRNGYT